MSTAIEIVNNLNNEFAKAIFEKLINAGRPIHYLIGDLKKEFGGSPFSNTEKSIKVKEAIDLLINNGVVRTGRHLAHRDYNSGMLQFIIFEHF